MTRALPIAAALAFASTGAWAQPCLTLSDGSGNTTVSCPDGRTGLLHTDPAGGVSGLIGGQVYQGLASNPGLPQPLPGGAPSTSYLIAPPPPSLAAPSPPPPPAVASLPPPAPETDLTQLQREYQAEQASLRARRAAAEQAKAKEAATKETPPEKAATAAPAAR
jgi:hypothetical protein